MLKSGSLFKKTQRTKRWIKHWFVLKNDVLSWYQSASVRFICWRHVFSALTPNVRIPTSRMASSISGMRLAANQ